MKVMAMFIFRTRQFNGYGKLSHQSLDDLKVGARIEAGEQKRRPRLYVMEESETWRN